jgi:hypothetical protein
MTKRVISYDNEANHRRHKPPNKTNVCVGLVELETPKVQNMILIFCIANASRNSNGTSKGHLPQ